MPYLKEKVYQRVLEILIYDDDGDDDEEEEEKEEEEEERVWTTKL